MVKSENFMAFLWQMSLIFTSSFCAFTSADEADADGLPIAFTSYYLCIFHITGVPIDAKPVIIILGAICDCS